MAKVLKLKRTEIKESVLKYIDDNAEYTSNFWSIAFYSKKGGVYSGFSKVTIDKKDKVYGFVIDFVHKYFSIEGISGNQLKKSASNLGDVFGRTELRQSAQVSDTLNKFYKLGQALGNVSTTSSYWSDYTREEVNYGRGIMRGIETWPVSEQLTDCAWFKEYYNVGDFRGILTDIQKKYDAAKKKNLRKIINMPSRYYKMWRSLGDAGTARCYLSVKRETLEQIEQALDVAKQVDKERGYHDAEEWQQTLATGLIKSYYSYTNTWSSCLNFISRNSNSDPVNNLVRYLYASCYHQQALDSGDALTTLLDYYRNVQNDNNPVKYPRYLKTAHDVASANRAMLSDTGNEAGVINNYIQHQGLEGSFGDWSFIVAASASEISDEANQQSNCVRGYIRSVAEGVSTIMFMRKSETIKQSSVTFEVREDSIVQAYSTFNHYLDKEQSKALRQYAKAKGLSINLGSVQKIDDIRKPVMKDLPEFHSEETMKAVKGKSGEPEEEPKFKAKIVAA